MPNWIIYAVIAQFFFAIVALIDKYIITSKVVPRPIVYAFYVSLFSTSGILFFLVGFIDLPFGDLQLPQISNIALPSLPFIILSLVMGYSLVLGFFYLFKAFHDADASDVVPIFQSVIAVFSFILPFVFFDEVLSRNFILGFIFLVVGTILVSRFRVTKKIVVLAGLAGVLFAINIFAFDIMANSSIFEFTSRDNALFWSRLGIGLAALSLLLLPNCCGGTTKDDAKHTARRKGFFIIFGNRILNGIAGFLIVTAVALAGAGELSLINALGGLQFMFLLIFAIFFGDKTPYACGENCTPRERIQKFVSIAVILIGFILLFI